MAGGPSAATAALLALLNCPRGTPFAVLRQKYLERAMATHPDRRSAESDVGSFVELQSAWEAYERAHPSGERSGGFTKFGVGCSWTDGTDERAEREEVTDAASRGETLRRTIREE